MEFREFPKIARLSREICITEKIDGTNGCICITEDGQFLTGSRTKWITPENDNHGFARWANENKTELIKLGVGTHFGEWWGCGIQRNYGLKEKRFSLFNVFKWKDENIRPKCCFVVPVLWEGIFNTGNINFCLEELKLKGSIAAPGFMEPEGIVIFHKQGNFMLKKTIEKDQEYKSQTNGIKLLGEVK